MNNSGSSPENHSGCAVASGAGLGSGDSELLSTTKAFYVSADDNPNMVVFVKMEKILERMQEEKSGVTIRTVKSFMSKIPSVFTGQDLIAWLLANMDFSDVNEALCLANRMASFGYFFPVDDHVLTVKNDSTYYRFQVSPYNQKPPIRNTVAFQAFWPRLAKRRGTKIHYSISVISLVQALVDRCAVISRF